MFVLNLVKDIRRFIIYKILKLRTRGVRVIITNSEKIFLIKHWYDNFWVLPGGGVKKNESVFDAAKRETEEEAGLLLKGNLIKVGKYQNNTKGKNDIVYIVACNKWSNSSKKRRLIDKIEVQKGNWFDFNHLPQISRSTSKRLAEYRGRQFSEEIRIW